MNLTVALLMQGSYWILNKDLMKALDGNLEATLLLSDLISRYGYFYKSNQLDENGGFFVLSSVLEEELFMEKRKRIKLLAFLEEKGVLSIKSKTTTVSAGPQTVNFFYINEEKIELLLGGGSGKNATGGGHKNVPTGGYKNAPLIRIREEEREEKEKISSEQVYRSWLASLPQSSNYNDCYDELLTLFTTLHSNKLKESDISSSLKKKIMSRWERSKYPIKQANAWDRAAGEVWSVKLEVYKKEKKPKIDFDKIDIVISNVINDDELDKIMKENEALMKDLEDAGD